MKTRHKMYKHHLYNQNTDNHFVNNHNISFNDNNTNTNIITDNTNDNTTNDNTTNGNTTNGNTTNDNTIKYTSSTVNYNSSSNIIEKSNVSNYLFNFFINILNYLYVATKIYIVWITLHYIASHLYIYLCVPKTIWGFIASPFMSVTPQCQSLRWIIYNGANVINNMWIGLGSWFSALLLSMNSYENNSQSKS